MKKFHSIVGGKSAGDGTSVDDPIALQIRADDKEAAHAPFDKVSCNDDAKPSEDAQPGVKKIEAVTLAWSKKTAFAVLVLYVLQVPAPER